MGRINKNSSFASRAEELNIGYFNRFFVVDRDFELGRVNNGRIEIKDFVKGLDSKGNEGIRIKERHSNAIPFVLFHIFSKKDVLLVFCLVYKEAWLSFSFYVANGGRFVFFRDFRSFREVFDDFSNIVVSLFYFLLFSKLNKVIFNRNYIVGTHLSVSKSTPVFSSKLYNIFQIGWSNGCRVRGAE